MSSQSGGRSVEDVEYVVLQAMNVSGSMLCGVY